MGILEYNHEVYVSTMRLKYSIKFCGTIKEYLYQALYSSLSHRLSCALGSP